MRAGGGPRARTRTTAGLRRVVVVVLTGWVLLLGLAPPANAHAFLLFSDPAFDGAMADSPEAVNLVFSEAVDAGTATVTLSDPGGREIRIDPPVGAEGDTILTSSIAQELDAGIYQVTWEVDGDDGHGAAGSFRFAVGTALIGGASQATVEPTDWGAAGLKWLLVAGFTVALGGLVGERLTSASRKAHADLPRIRPWSRWGAAVGLGSVLISGWVLVVDRGSASSLFSGPPGWRILAESAGFTAAWVFLRAGRGWLAALALLVVAAAEGFDSHSDLALPVVGLLLTGVHLIAAGIWVGALLHVTRAAVAWRKVPGLSRQILVAYAAVAAKLFAVVVVTGTLMAVLLVPFSSLTSTAYGRALLLKIALVGVIAALALIGRWALRRRTLRRTVLVGRTEVVGLSLVLVVAALLVSTATPDSVVAGPPPPPTGTPVPAGGLAGQVGVNAVASDGQLVVRLSSPQAGNAYEPGEPTDYSLVGQVASDTQQTELDFRSCGEGCFVTSYAWSDGDNVLSLRADASGWKGGSLSSLITWPGVPEEGLLERTARTMSQMDVLRIYETGTSDGTSALPPPYQVSVSGEEYIAGSLFGSGVAPVAVLLPAASGNTRLMLGFPSSGVFADLTIDDDGRIIEETTASPKHVFRRRFDYSSP